MDNDDKIKGINNPHDALFKSTFLVKENLQDLLLGTLPKEVLQGLKTETLEYDPNEYVDDDLSPYFKDISCNLKYGHSNIKISLLYEHKSYPDKNIHLQLLRYILNVWENQAANKQELTPVITMVFYHGKRKWTDLGFVKNVPEELKRFVPLFDYTLFDTKEIEDHAIIQHFRRPSVKVAVWFMKRSDNLLNFMQENPEIARRMFMQIEQIDENLFQKLALYLYSVSGVEPDKINAIMETVTQQKQHPFANAIRKIEQSGMEKEKKQIAVNMIKKGSDDEFIAEVTGLSVAQIKELRQEAK